MSGLGVFQGTYNQALNYLPQGPRLRPNVAKKEQAPTSVRDKTQLAKESRQVDLDLNRLTFIQTGVKTKQDYDKFWTQNMPELYTQGDMSSGIFPDLLLEPIEQEEAPKNGQLRQRIQLAYYDDAEVLSGVALTFLDANTWAISVIKNPTTPSPDVTILIPTETYDRAFDTFFDMFPDESRQQRELQEKTYARAMSAFEKALNSQTIALLFRDIVLPKRVGDVELNYEKARSIQALLANALRTSGKAPLENYVNTYERQRYEASLQSYQAYQASLPQERLARFLVIGFISVSLLVVTVLAWPLVLSTLAGVGLAAGIGVLSTYILGGSLSVAGVLYGAIGSVRTIQEKRSLPEESRQFQLVGEGVVHGYSYKNPLPAAPSEKPTSPVISDSPLHPQTLAEEGVLQDVAQTRQTSPN